MYVIIVTPYEIAFIQNNFAIFEIIDDTITACFILDVLLNCNTAILIDDALCHDRLGIIKNYIQNWMLVDISAAIPFRYFLESFSWVLLIKSSKFFRLSSCLKLSRLVKICKILKVSYSNDNIFSMNWISQVSPITKKFVSFILIFLGMVHFVSCMWYFISTLNIEYNWVIAYGMINSGSQDLYISSFYWVITTVTTVGYGDIKPVNDSERIFCIFVMIGGVYFYSYTIGTITTLIFEFEKKKNKTHNKFLILQEITKDCLISEKFEKRIKNAIINDQMSANKEQKYVFDSLPRRLALQLNFLIKKKLVQKSNKFFDKKPLSFITQILEVLKPIKISSREILFYETDFSTEVYFITKGEVNLFGVYKENEISFEKLFDGDFFGEVGVLLEENRAFSAKTTKISEFLVLDKIDLNKILSPFVRLKSEMVEQALDRKNYYENRRQNAFAEYLSNKRLANFVISDDNIGLSYKSPDFESEKIQQIRDILPDRTLKMMDIKRKSVREIVDNIQELKEDVARLYEKLFN